MEPEIVDVENLCDDCARINFSTILRFIACCKEDVFVNKVPKIRLASLHSMRARNYCQFCQTIVRLVEAYWADEFDCGLTDYKSQAEYLRFRWQNRFGLTQGEVQFDVGWKPILVISGSCASWNIDPNRDNEVYGTLLLEEVVSVPLQVLGKQHKGLEGNTTPAYQLPPQCSAPRKSVIAVNAIKSWLDTCKLEHVGECDSYRPGNIHSEAADVIFVDVHQHKLVHSRTSERYYALSYVWGARSNFCSNKDNFTELFQEGALRKRETSIPLVIIEAMDLVRSLGGDYLWVDSLCICQDDELQKHTQIAQMSKIYGHAFLTIAATVGDNAGIGLIGSGPRILPAFTIQRIKFTHKPNYLTSRLFTETIYESRAWTLQERLLCNRCLFFTRHEVFFVCRNGQILTIGDSTELLWLVKKLIALHKICSFGTWDEPEALHSYDQLLSDYSSRSLSYPADILNAFSGIAAIIAESYNDNFLYGLPQAIIGFCLLWCPETSPSSRRMVDGRPAFPTWSWAGWVTRVYHPLLSPSLAKDGILGVAYEGFASLIDQFFIEESSSIRSIPQHNAPYSTPHRSHTGRKPPLTIVNIDRPVLHFIAATLPASTFVFVDAVAIKSDFPMSDYCNRFVNQPNYLFHATEEVGHMLSYQEDIREQLSNPVFQFVALATKHWPPQLTGYVIVMLVALKDGEYYERVGLGVVQEDVWESRRPSQKYIQLA